MYLMILMLILFIQSTSEIARVQEDTTGIDLSNFKHHSSHFSLVVSKFANLLLWMRGIIIHTQAWNWISEITILCFISRVCYGELPSKVWDVQNVESNVMINAKIYSTPIVFNVSFKKYFIIYYKCKDYVQSIVGSCLESRLWTTKNVIQLNEYETAPHFIQLTQNLTSGC